MVKKKKQNNNYKYLENICNKIVKHRYKITQFCGYCCPLKSPNYNLNLKENENPYEYCSKKWMLLYNCNKLKSILQVLLRVIKINVNRKLISKLCFDARCVHMIRLCSTILRLIYVLKTDLVNKHSCTYYLCQFIYNVLATRVYMLNFKKIETNHYKYGLVNVKDLNSMEYKLNNIVGGKHCHFNICKSPFRYYFVNSFYAKLKREINKYYNNFVTLRRSTALEYIRSEIKPDINYIRRLATVKLILNYCISMTTGKLISFNTYLYQKTCKNTHLKKCADNLYLMWNVCKMGKIRINTKLVEVNPRECTCYAKCLGPIGATSFKDKVWESFELNSGIVICGACRLNGNIKNVSINESRKMYCSTTPEISICSHDGCTVHKFIRLVIMDVAIDNKYSIYTRYSHRLYASDITNIASVIACKERKGKRGQLYGMCYGGKRTCYKNFIKPSPAQLTKKLKDGSTIELPDYSNVKYWATCDNCRINDYDYSAKSSLDLISYFNSSSKNDNISTYSTCLMKWFSRKLFLKEHMCKGCKLAALCSHLDKELLNIIKYNKNNFQLLSEVSRKLSKLIELRKWLKEVSSWNRLID